MVPKADLLRFMPGYLPSNLPWNICVLQIPDGCPSHIVELQFRLAEANRFEALRQELQQKLANQ